MEKIIRETMRIYLEIGDKVSYIGSTTKETTFFTSKDILGKVRTAVEREGYDIEVFYDNESNVDVVLSSRDKTVVLYFISKIGRVEKSEECTLQDLGRSRFVITSYSEPILLEKEEIYELVKKVKQKN